MGTHVTANKASVTSVLASRAPHVHRNACRENTHAQKGKFLTPLKKRVWAWWQRSLIPVLGRQRHVDLREFKASLVYIVSSRTAWVTGQ